MERSSHQDEIWEQMLINERRQLATQRGYARVSDYEEEASLNSAINESLRPSSHTSIPSIRQSDTQYSRNSIDVISSAKDCRDLDVFMDDSCILDGNVDESASSLVSAAPADNDHKNEEKESIWIFLPSELAQRILLILGDVDSCG